MTDIPHDQDESAKRRPAEGRREGREVPSAATRMSDGAADCARQLAARQKRYSFTLKGKYHTEGLVPSSVRSW